MVRKIKKESENVDNAEDKLGKQKEKKRKKRIWKDGKYKNNRKKKGGEENKKENRMTESRNGGRTEQGINDLIEKKMKEMLGRIIKRLGWKKERTNEGKKGKKQTKRRDEKETWNSKEKSKKRESKWEE